MRPRLQLSLFKKGKFTFGWEVQNHSFLEWRHLYQVFCFKILRIFALLLFLLLSLIFMKLEELCKIFKKFGLSEPTFFGGDILKYFLYTLNLMKLDLVLLDFFLMTNFCSVYNLHWVKPGWCNHKVLHDYFMGILEKVTKNHDWFNVTW